MFGQIRYHIVILLFVTATGLSIGCAGTASEVSVNDEFGDTSTLVITNLSYSSISEVYFGPSSETTWGTNLLPIEQIEVGDTFKISGIADGSWDLRLVDNTGAFRQLYGESFEGGEYYVDVGPSGWYYQSASR